MFRGFLSDRSMRIKAVVPILIALALGLTGCGGDGPSPSKAKKTSVLMMRHCVRSMPEDGVYANPELKYFNNYSAKPWPEFKVPDMHCTANGKKLIVDQSKWLKENGNLPLPMHVIADDCERDDVTGHALLEGLGMTAGIDGTTFKTAGINGTFNPYEYNKTAAACLVSNADIKAAIQAQLETYPMPSNFAPLFAKIFNVSGKGVAGDWTTSGCEVTDDAISDHWWAPIVGGCNVANEFTERFMMEWGNDMKVGWGHLEPSEIKELLVVHGWYLTVALNAFKLQKVKASSIAWAILDALEAGEQGTTAFVGHDTQQGGLNGALGISWDPSPWPINATTPGSALRFDKDGDSDTVSVSYVFNNDLSGVDMQSVPVTFPGFKAGTITMKGLRDLVQKNIVEACALRSAKTNAAAPGLDELVV